MLAVNNIFGEYTKLLSEFIKFKSISTDPQYKDEIKKTVDWLVKLLKQNKFKVNIFDKYANPIILAEYNVSKNAKTVLIYGHYDVQPANKEDGWQSDPFVLTKRDNKFYARGVVDNKGQFFIHLISIIHLIKENKLNFNIKFLLEVNEETGSDGIPKFIKNNKQLLRSDIVLISDGEMPYQPVLTASFRGTFNITLKVKTASNNLHSGLYGGPTPNAGLELAKILAQLYNSDYTVDINNFYKKDPKINPVLLKQLQDFDKSRESVLKHTGVKYFHNYKCNSFSATVGLSTMFTITGIKTGYIGDGYSNIIPNIAIAKLNFRVAQGQDPRKIFEVVKNKVKQIAPKYVEWEFVDMSEIVDPVMVNVNSKEFKEVTNLLEKVYNLPVLVDYCGATLPIVVDIKNELKTDPLLVSLGNDDCNMHGVDENFDIGLIKKGIEFSLVFFSGR